MNTDTILTILGVLLGSTLLGQFLSNRHSVRMNRKELIAGATKSALRRVEMYYRVRRRNANGSDDSDIRNVFHDVQEENDYYRSLLTVESVWLGASYEGFIAALKRETMPLIQDAWDSKPFGPGAKLQDIKHPQVEHLRAQFARDARRYLNPVVRPLMRIRYWLRKYVGDDGYGSL